MGDRGNLAIIDGRDRVGDPSAIYLHTHWAGTRLPHNLAEYLSGYRGTVEPSDLYEFLRDREVKPELSTAYFDLEASHPIVWAIDLLDRRVYKARVDGTADGRLTANDLSLADCWSFPEFIENHAITVDQIRNWDHVPVCCLTGNLYGADEEHVQALAARPDMERVRATLRMHEEFEKRQAARETETTAPAMAQTQDLGITR